MGGFGRLGPLLASPWPLFGLLLGSLGRPLASLWPLLASPWPPFGLPWPPLVALWPPLACPLAHLSVPLALPWRLLASLGVLWRPFGLPYRKKQDDRGQRTQNHMTKKAWMAGFPDQVKGRGLPLPYPCLGNPSKPYSSCGFAFVALGRLVFCGKGGQTVAKGRQETPRGATGAPKRR